MDRPTRVKQKDRTGVIISIVIHVVVIGISLFVLSRTEMGQRLLRGGLGVVRDEKRPPPPKTAAPKTTTKSAKAADTGPKSSSSRRVATDAPPAAGEGLAVESQEKKSGPASGGEGKTDVAVKVVGPPPKLPPPPKIFASAAPKSDIKQLHVQRAREAAATESFGTEQISKSGASDAGAIVNKIAGASIVDGKFAVIRGLSDRYVTTTFNGGEIPSADPYRRAASLDMFPAQIIDKVVVSKTFTPDQQGAFTGGGINIVSKSFPEKGFVTLSLGGAYNSQSTGNDDFLTYDGGGLDWAGMDDGTRALPDSLSAPDLTLPTAPSTSGLPSNPNFARNIQNAETLDTATKELGTTQFAGVKNAPPPNHNFSLAAGDTTYLFGKPFGVFISGSYRHDYRFFDEGIQSRYRPVGGNPGVYEVSRSYDDTTAVDTVNWNAMVALAYQPWVNHVLSFNYLHNQNSDNLVRRQFGSQQSDPDRTFYLNRLQWTERALDTFQLRGNHEIPDLAGVKFDWLTVYSTTTQDEPDVRFFNYSQIGGNYEVGHASNPEPRQPTRYYRTLEENNVNAKGDVTLPFRQWSGLESELKAGGFYSQSERTFTDREFFYNGDAPFNGDPNQYLTPNNLGYNATTNPVTRRINYNWQRYIQTRNSSYDGTATIPAGYLMFDMPVAEPGWSGLEKVRLVGGVRYEVTEMTVNSQSYQANSITGQRTNTSVINQVDWLPAAGAIISLNSNMNLRLHYSETVARPSFRELAAYRSYDPVLDETLEGNPNLTMSASQNFDLRWEWFFAPGELLSAGIFYKKLSGPIERFFVTLDQDIVSYLNRDQGTVLGVEFEARKSLGFLDHSLANFTVGGNVSLIDSETQLTDTEYNNKITYVPDASRNRQLYDQSPYIINLDLSYDNPRTGTSASLLYNVAGPRITIASLTTEDVFEQPAPVLDFVISQKIGRNLTLRLSARNLLNPFVERTYGEDSDLLYSSNQRGRTYGISLSYEF